MYISIPHIYLLNISFFKIFSFHLQGPEKVYQNFLLLSSQVQKIRLRKYYEGLQNIGKGSRLNQKWKQDFLELKGYPQTKQDL